MEECKIAKNVSGKDLNSLRCQEWATYSSGMKTFHHK
jgi:hypothetical protein